MQVEIISETVAKTGIGHDFSMFGMFLQADIVVKSVMVILVIASVWSWAVMIDKSMTFRRLASKASKFEKLFWSGRPLEELFKRLRRNEDHPMARVFVSGMEEWERAIQAPTQQTSTQQGRLTISAGERIAKIMDVEVARQLEKAQSNLSVLATIGSAAPFIGLFGTVWGIMNAFQAIAVTKDTNLAVVAPGIAEALFATALGLVAAIPAVIGYNRYAAALNSYGVRLQGFADEFAAILSRQAD